MDCTRAMAAFTSSSVRYMSHFQSKNRSISAVPRLVTDHKWSRPGTVLTRLFESAGDRDQHLVDRENAIVRAYHDAREIRIRKHGDRNGQRQIDAHRDQREDHEDDRLAVAGGPVRRLLRGARRTREYFAHLCFPAAGFAAPLSLPGGSGALSSSSSLSSTAVVTTFTFALIVESHATDYDDLFSGSHSCEDLDLFAFAHAQRNYPSVNH